MDQINELKNQNGEIAADDIKKIIPYDHPFLFLDRVISLTNEKIVAVKDLSGKEDFFNGHFVGFPIMPGALTVEGMGQASTLLVRYNLQDHKEKDILAYKLKEVKFMAPIFPGSQIRFEADLIAQDERGAVLKAKAFIKEDAVAETFIVFVIVNKSEFRAKYSR